MEWVYSSVSSHWAYILMFSPSSRQRSDCCCSDAMISVDWIAICFCGYHLHLIAEGVHSDRHIVIPTIAIGDEVGLRPLKKGITSWIQFAEVFLQICQDATGQLASSGRSNMSFSVSRSFKFWPWWFFLRSLYAIVAYFLPLEFFLITRLVFINLRSPSWPRLAKWRRKSKYFIL